MAPRGYGGPRRVSLNSFGYGGTNAHLILESYHSTSTGVVSTNGHHNESEDSFSNGITSINGSGGHGSENGQLKAPTNGISSTQVVNGNTLDSEAKAPIKTNGHIVDTSWNANWITRNDLQLAPLLFPITARSEVALAALPRNLQQWLAKHDITRPQFRDLSYTLSCRRSCFRWRSVIVATDPVDLSAKLGTAIPKTRAATSHALAFVFTGQGAQWFAMGRELIAVSPCFKNSISESDEALRRIGCDWSLLEELSRPESESRVGQSEISQPSTSAVQIALVDLLASFGIIPSCVVGHSSGEIAGAYAAGALSLQAAIQV